VQGRHLGWSYPPHWLLYEGLQTSVLHVGLMAAPHEQGFNYYLLKC